MSYVQVREIKIGEGIPKICVPIVAQTQKDIFAKAEEIRKLPIDVVEWRADWYQEAIGSKDDPAEVNDESLKQILKTAAGLRNILGEIPLLFTFRTKTEGGEQEIALEDYERMNRTIASEGNVDLVDLELLTEGEHMADMVQALHESGAKVVASSHDFNKTPEEEEIIRRLCRMQECGSDIAKMAVMPNCRKDVLTLLSATVEMLEKHPETPVITMSMSAKGVSSRLIGECFGSALTFGAVGQASAPGQIGVSDLRSILEIIHKSL